MIGRNPLQVELVEHSSRLAPTGIGRYMRDLYKGLVPHIAVTRTTHIDPPFTRYLSFLHHLPLGIRAHRAGRIVHFTEELGCAQMMWRPVRPAVGTVHDLGMLAWPPEAHMHRALDRVLIRLSYLGLKRLDAIIAVSEYSRQTLIRKLHIPPERVFTVYSGLDGHLFRRTADARQQLESRFHVSSRATDRYLLYVGSEFPRKNLITLFRVLSQLPAHVCLLKVGDAGGRRFRQQTNQLIHEFDLAERVRFFDHVSEADLSLFYSAADVYVCASFLEGFGHPILEAMACGTPVVCSNAASLPEVAGSAACLVPPNDVATFTAAVLAILNDSELAAHLSTCGLQQAARFSWERTARAVIDVYRQSSSTSSG
jgi:glycosyltransferase involved in cell wall biosynthesis